MACRGKTHTVSRSLLPRRGGAVQLLAGGLGHFWPGSERRGLRGMAGVEIAPEAADGTYLGKVKPIAAAEWVSQNPVPAVVAYGTHDRSGKEPRGSQIF